MDMQSLFADASRTLFRVKTLFSIVSIDQDNVLGYGKLSRKWGELRERCDVLELQNSNTEKELDELRESDDALNFLHKKVN